MGIKSDKDYESPTAVRGLVNENFFLLSPFHFSLASSAQDLSNPLFVWQIKGGLVLFCFPARKKQLEVEWHRTAVVRFVGGKFLPFLGLKSKPPLDFLQEVPIWEHHIPVPCVPHRRGRTPEKG